MIPTLVVLCNRFAVAASWLLTSGCFSLSESLTISSAIAVLAFLLSPIKRTPHILTNGSLCTNEVFATSSLNPPLICIAHNASSDCCASPPVSIFSSSGIKVKFFLSASICNACCLNHIFLSDSRAISSLSDLLYRLNFGALSGLRSAALNL